MHRPCRPPTRLLLAALLLLGLCTAPAASALTSTKYYADAVSPTTPVQPGAAVDVTLTDCGCGTTTSTQPFGSAEVTLPTGTSWGVASPAVSASSPGADVHWTAVPLTRADGTRVVRLTNDGTGTTWAVTAGGSVTAHLLLQAAQPGSYPLSTSVRQSNDFSGSGNGFTRLPAANLTVTVAPAPDHLAFRVQPTTVQVTPSSTSPAARTLMCPVVAVVDREGATVTGVAPTAVTLVPAAGGSAGLSPTTATTAAGVASFGTPDGGVGRCATGLTASVLGSGYTVTASATVSGRTLVSSASAPFAVLPYYADCPATCSSPTVAGPHTTAQVDAAGGTSGAAPLAVAVGLQDAVDKAAGCNPDPVVGAQNPYRDVAFVDLLDHTKSVTLVWDKAAVQWSTNNGTVQWDVCFAGPDGFLFVPKGSATAASTGVLNACGDVDPLTTPCVSRLFRTAGSQGAVVSLPDVDGDPKLW